jgi:hypothetical protein
MRNIFLKLIIGFAIGGLSYYFLNYDKDDKQIIKNIKKIMKDKSINIYEYAI